MNPFLESTVATSSPGVSAESNQREARPWRRKNQTRRRVVRMLGCAALGLAGHLLASGPALALDVNAATEAQLKSVRGIGPKTARLIVEERMRGGNYDSIDDLAERVKGIGSKKAATLRAGGLVTQDTGESAHRRADGAAAGRTPVKTPRPGGRPTPNR